jgi:uncharacterized membrane protein YoaK (UPF0700 family)
MIRGAMTCHAIGMPLFYLRRLTGSKRTKAANRHLAWILAFVAGAINAGGFLAVRQFTSHMTGIVAGVAYNLALTEHARALTALSSLGAFILGALVTSLCVRWAASRELESVYALPLLVEAGLLVVFGLTGHKFTGGRVVGTIMLLCFTMGLQNAIITKLSNSEIRTTHLTGMVTDIGIGFGRIIYTWLSKTQEGYSEELAAIGRLSMIVGMFFAGGVVGALGFQYAGFLFTLPFAGALVVLAIVPVIEDLRRRVNTVQGGSDSRET